MTPSHVEVNRCAGGCNHRQQSCLPTRVRKKKIPVSQCTNENTQPSILIYYCFSTLALFSFYFRLLMAINWRSLLFLLLLSVYKSRGFFFFPEMTSETPLLQRPDSKQCSILKKRERGKKRSCQPYSRGLERLSFHFEKNDVRVWCLGRSNKKGHIHFYSRDYNTLEPRYNEQVRQTLFVHYI